MKRRIMNVLLVFTGIAVFISGGIWNINENNKIKKGQKQNTEDVSVSTSTQYRFPAEFDKQQAIWMQWPSEVYNQASRPVIPVMLKIIKALASHVRVNIASRSVDEIVTGRKLLKQSGYTGQNVHFYVINHMSIWARDVGPIFVKDVQNKLRVVDFKFNNYSRGGSQYYIDVENQVDTLTAKLYGFPVIKSSLISEGGAVETNGRGTIMLTESVLLKRNPDLTKQQIENEFKRVLGIKKVVWLKKGLAEDDNITSGHINEIARFASPNTILLAYVKAGDRYLNNYSKESYLRMEENYNILKNSTDQDGKPFRIIRVPVPPTLYNVTDSAGRLPIRSYLNYAVTNGAVIMQTYWRQGRSSALKETEDGVKEILKGVYPGRKVIGIDTESLNLWGGGIHCITQHMPAY
ncbi:agmatine deiminase family protein [Pseudobacteroides cellulosolvens]|uniref:Agmatine deiminase n=1 Tax=Pseudobacteroides cellulosolvens ATCC 35603 = DSM 2933 TaxID=398512 RepID=A0A0L6JMR3_9FIRM|nr:agmatine deiminase family protein [Pseudobacteroides cellulosolvens]KNY27059.1 Agmatine deiminase [Pseudobacteroides cellulosolvens ATCC 35603 = DSM 2933]